MPISRAMSSARSIHSFFISPVVDSLAMLPSSSASAMFSRDLVDLGDQLDGRGAVLRRLQEGEPAIERVQRLLQRPAASP